jgi:hypothetical protein
MKAVCDTAHALGVPVVAHCRSASLHPRRRARRRRPHPPRVVHRRRGARRPSSTPAPPMCPTFTFLANLADHGDKVGAGDGMTDIFRGEIKATAAMMRQAYDAGVPSCAAPRAASPSPRTGTGTPANSRCSSTSSVCPRSRPSRARRATMRSRCGWQGELGVLAEGYRADVLVVDGDPATDVRILQDRHRLNAVISRGAMVDLSPNRGPSAAASRARRSATGRPRSSPPNAPACNRDQP